MLRLIFLLIACFTSLASAASPMVTELAVPDGGIQPQVAVDDQHTVHLIYYKGDSKAGDIYYVKSTDDGKTWSKPIRVNSQAGSAIALGTIRGGQLAVGKDHRVHVAWNGSDIAPRNPSTPMLYARLNDDGNAFEEQRNVIPGVFGIDGGGSVAADANGNVWVAVHALAKKGGREPAREIWLARSSDDGKTFADPVSAVAENTGACGCCAMRIYADETGLYGLYRAATNMTQRDSILLTGDATSSRLKGADIAQYQDTKCIMSSYAFAPAPGKLLLAIEATEGRIEWGSVDPKTKHSSELQNVPSRSKDQKHPALAANIDGDAVVAWTEGTPWKKGGGLHWELYDKNAKPVSDSGEKALITAVWSFPAVFATKEGGFIVLY